MTNEGLMVVPLQVLSGTRLEVLVKIDNTHAAFTRFLENPKVANGLTNHISCSTQCSGR